MSEPEVEAQASAPVPADEQLDALFAPWNRSDAPGLVVGVALKGETIYRRGFGMASLETAVANTPATRMRIGSTSKHFTCLLALLLAEEGKLDIDAPIRTYVEELTGPAGAPTLRQLMQHVGGSRCYLDLGFIGRGLTAPPTGTALKAMVDQTGRNFAPGEAMIYNNGGYHLLSIAIKRAGGAPFEDQLKTRIFDPMGMGDTASVPSDHDITPGVATLHTPRPGGGWRRGLFPSEEVRGEGAMVSTIDDMLRWMAHLRRRDRLGTPQMWAEMTTPPTHPDGTVGMYALGLMLEDYRGLKTVHHAGGVIGGSCQMLTLPDEGLDVIVICNGAPAADPVRLAEQVVDIVLADRVGPEAPRARMVDHEALKGSWYSRETGVLYTLIDQDGELKLAFGHSPMGLPLRVGEGGGLVAPAGSLGEIGLTPNAAGDRMTIRFGGKAADYVRPPATPDAAAAFAQAAEGRYHSAETGITASIARDGDTLKLSMSDGLGRVEADLIALDDRLAAPEASTPFARFGGALSLVGEGDRASGLIINTMRTRDLAFTRSD